MTAKGSCPHGQISAPAFGMLPTRSDVDGLADAAAIAVV